MRNIFDQYGQPENRLTHALVSALHNDRRLIRPFLRWLGAKSVPPLKDIRIGQQQAPGTEAEGDKEESEGVPDACFFDEESWAVLVESKVQAKASLPQLLRHRRLARRYGYAEPHVVLLSVDSVPKYLPERTTCRAWCEVYAWFCRRAGQSEWAQRFIDYMHVFEAKMAAQNYSIRGTLTMFSGFLFTEENPYTYREGKRLIRLMGQEFRKDGRLVKELGIDPKGKGRSALTRGKDGGVWDFIPLKRARGKTFTAFPHATMDVRPDEASIAITIPNGIRSGIKRKLRDWDRERFENMLMQVEVNLRSTIRRAPTAKPMLYIVQRHYRSQRSPAVTDGRVDVDLRTVLNVPTKLLKHQPGWLDAVLGLLTEKRTNIQTGIEVHLPYKATVMQDSNALKVMADAWIALKPLLSFGLSQ